MVIIAGRNFIISAAVVIFMIMYISLTVPSVIIDVRALGDIIFSIVDYIAMMVLFFVVKSIQPTKNAAVVAIMNYVITNSTLFLCRSILCDRLYITIFVVSHSKVRNCAIAIMVVMKIIVVNVVVRNFIMKYICINYDHHLYRHEDYDCRG